MPIPGNYRKLYLKFKYIVIIQGSGGGGDFESAAFSKASGLKVDLTEIKYSEGGAYIDYKEPGKLEVGDITLARGVSKNQDMYNWLLLCVNAMAKLPGGLGAVSPSFFKDLTIRQLDRDDTPALDHRLYWAFPKSLSMGDWDSNANEVSIEEMTVGYHHPERRVY